MDLGARPGTSLTVDLDDAQRALTLAESLVSHGIAALRAHGVDEQQVLAYDVAHGAAAAATARAGLEYGRSGDLEARLACAFVADVVSELQGHVAGRSSLWSVGNGIFEPVEGFLARHRDPTVLAALCGIELPRRLSEELELARETFHRFALLEIRPHAERVHRENADIPERIVDGLAEVGGFGLSVPEEYGGAATGTESDYLAMVVATEELSWGSLGIGGSLITRPEILTRALVSGGTDEQKRRWLPKLASGELLVAVAVTEPDYGSDVAEISTSATAAEGGWRVNGVKTWCTFAARADALMLLARTDPDRTKRHRGLSLFVVDKEPATGRGFVIRQDGGTLEGRPIDTLGYRGMHSYELAFENWFVPRENLVGGDAGAGRGFYLQMQGFENGR
ncbi:MAG: acyl-CoA dehydrogenase family protein, partial [Acidimicrobiales bacterium]